MTKTNIHSSSKHAVTERRTWEGNQDKPLQGRLTVFTTTNRNTVNRAKLISGLTKSLLEACVEEIEESGRALNGLNNPARLRIVNAFFGKTGKWWTNDQFKN